MRGDSLLRTIIEGRMEGKTKRGRPRVMLPDWMSREDYSKLKERAGHCGDIGLTNLPAKEGKAPRRTVQ